MGVVHMANRFSQLQAGLCKKVPAEVSGNAAIECAQGYAELPGQFDPDSFSALVTRQKLLIAQAAGIDPSQIRIRIGH